MRICQLFKRSKHQNTFPFYEAEGHCFPEVYFDVSFSCAVSHKLGKETEAEFFKFMHAWERHHFYCIRFIGLHKVFENDNRVRIAVDFGECKFKIVKALIKWLRKTKLPITRVVMHSDD